LAMEQQPQPPPAAKLARLRGALLDLWARRCPDPSLPQIIEALNRHPIRSLSLLSS